jgi:hypothetical protein
LAKWFVGSSSASTNEHPQKWLADDGKPLGHRADFRRGALGIINALSVKLQKQSSSTPFQ